MTVPSPLPVIGAPMAGGPTTPELVAAVNAAGGVGVLSAGYLSAEALREAMKRTDALTAAPYGVNVFHPTPDFADPAAIADYAAALGPLAERLGVAPGEPRWNDDAYRAKIDLLVAAHVHTVGFTFGCPDPDDIARLHDAGALVTVTVTGPGEATRAAAAGADALVVQGAEAGGHQGRFDPAEPNHTPLLAALAAVRDVTRVPLVATGGIGSRTAAEAALAAGAVAVQIGTALLLADEAGTSAVYRGALAARSYPDTEITRAFSGRWARGLANRFLVEHRDAPGGYPQLHHLTRPLRAAAARQGDADVPNLWAGTSWRQAVPGPTADIVAAIVP